MVGHGSAFHFVLISKLVLRNVFLTWDNRLPGRVRNEVNPNPSPSQRPLCPDHVANRSRRQTIYQLDLQIHLSYALHL